MKERPNLFSAPMVRAILNGQKTQTRRVVTPQPDSFMGENGIEFDMPGWSVCVGPAKFARYYCPYGQPGDRLWVREAWRYDATGYADGGDVVYAADCARLSVADLQGRWDWGSDEPPDPPRATPTWRPSIHMPRWASRITLEITGVRAERLHQITEEDAIREGTREPSLVPIIGGAAVCERDAFADLWADINGRESWDANPWVWVVSFRRLEAKP